MYTRLYNMIYILYMLVQYTSNSRECMGVNGEAFIKSCVFYYKSHENPYQYYKSRENLYQVL